MERVKDERLRYGSSGVNSTVLSSRTAQDPAIAREKAAARAMASGAGMGSLKRMTIASSLPSRSLLIWSTFERVETEKRGSKAARTRTNPLIARNAAMTSLLHGRKLYRERGIIKKPPAFYQ